MHILGLSRGNIYRKTFILQGSPKASIMEKLQDLAHGDDYLAELYGELPGTLDNCYAEGTNKIYKANCKKWEKWCSRYQINSFPAPEEHVVLFILSILQQAKSSISLQHALYAIKWGHERQGLNFEFSPLIKKLLEASKRILGKPCNKKEPITSGTIKQLVTHFITENVILSDLRDVTMFVIGFCGFLRFNEIVNIKRSDIDFQINYVTIFLEKSKTDKYKEGNKVFLAETKSKACPVKLLRQYLKLACIKCDSEEYIFRAVTRMKSKDTHKSSIKDGKLVINKIPSYELRNVNTKLSYTRCRELLFSKLNEIGIDETKFGVHSLRSGGATQAARMQIPDRLFKKHGRWRSENCKDGYVHEDIKEKLSVTLSLGL